MIETLSNLHFQRPWWLVLIPLSIGLWWWWRRRSEPLRGWRDQMHPDLLRALVIGKNDAHQWSAYGVLAFWMVSIVSVAGPTWKLEPNPFLDDAQPVMLLLKASASMQVADPPPARLERAKLKITDLAKLRKGQPLGLIAYAGSAHLVLPPTKDTEIIGEMAAQISPEIMPSPGDRLDLAIGKAAELLRKSEGGTILVVADSVDVDQQAITDIKAATEFMPIQFLALADDGSPEMKSIRDAAKLLYASVQTLAVDDSDLASVIAFAEHKSAAGIAGESSRWQESGYWLTPLLALFVAISFRRQQRSSNTHTATEPAQ